MKKIFKIIALVLITLGIALWIFLALLGRGHFEGLTDKYRFIRNVQKSLNKNVTFLIQEKNEIIDDKKNNYFEVKIETDRIYRSCGFSMQTNSTSANNITTVKLKGVEGPKGAACMATSPAQAIIPFQMEEGSKHELLLKKGFKTDRYSLSLDRGFINVSIAKSSFSKPKKDQFPRYSKFEVIKPKKEPFDASGLTFINKNYATDGESIYCKEELVEGADVESFMTPTFEKGYEFHAKDKNNAYFLGRLIPNVDIKSYEFLNDRYAKDKNSIYFREFKIEEADVNSFEILGDDYAKDKNQIYYRENPLSTADVNSFRFNKSSGLRTQDDYFVFKMGLRVSGDKDGFTVLKEGYAKDNNAAYLYDKAIVGSDPETFEYFDGAGSYYSHDKNNVYYKGELIEGSEGASFVEPLNRYYSMDGKSVYLDGVRIVGADPETFEILYREFTKDKNHAYFRGGMIKGSDGSTFEMVTNYYAKDKNRDYTYDEIFELSGVEID